MSVKKGTPDVHYADRIITILLHFNLPFSRSQTGPVIESITLLPLPFSGWSRRICVDRWLIGCFSADVEYGSNDIVAFLKKFLHYRGLKPARLELFFGRFLRKVVKVK